MNKYFHNFIFGVSVLPALLVVPAAAVDIEENIDLNSVFPTGVLSERINSIQGKTGTLTTDNISIKTSGTRAVQAWYENSKIVLGGENTKLVEVEDKDTIALIAGSGSEVDIKSQNLNVYGKDVAMHAGGIVSAQIEKDMTVTATNGNALNSYGSMDIKTKNLNIKSAYQDVTTEQNSPKAALSLGGSGTEMKITATDTINVEASGDAQALIAYGTAADTQSGHMTLSAKNINLSTDSTKYAAVHSADYTDTKIGKDSSKFVVVDITGNNVNIKAPSTGVAVMSQGVLNIKGNTSIVAKDAILARGNAQLYINKDTNNALKMDGDIAFDYDKKTSGTKVDAIVDITMSGSDSYWNGNTYASYGTGKAPDESYMKVNSIFLTMKNGAVWNATKIVDNMNDDTSGSGYVAMNNLDINKGTVNIADATRGIVVENSNVADATFNGGPLNIGTMTVSGGTNTFNTNVAGIVDTDSQLTIASDAVMNIGTNTVDVKNITLDGNMFATLREGDAQIKATSFDGNGKLNLTMTKVGTYNVFDVTGFGSNWSEGHVVNTNPIYELQVNNDGSVVASKKSVEEIASDTGMKADAAVTISRVADAASASESKQLQELSVKIQEKLVKNTPEAKAAVEHATKAINPETESVAQSVSTSVQNTVVSLASARMSAPSVGRNGGDVEFTSGGVWAQGLFNKSKQNDAFNGYTRGIALGMDGTINKDWTIGAGYSYAHSDIDGTARNTEIDSNTVFVYGQYKPTEWYVNAIANYTTSDYSERGTILDGITVTGDYSVDSFGGALATGYDFANGVTPELGLRYMHVNANDYANSYGIKTHMDDTDFLTGVFGVKYAFNVVANKYLTLVPQLNAGVKYDLLSDKNIATVAMPGLDAYTLEGNRLKRIGGEFGIGLGMQYRELNVSVNYDIDVREDYTSQTGMLKFRYNF